MRGFEAAEQLPELGYIEIYHGVGQGSIETFDQFGFGLKVLVHGGVEIEVVSREVGIDGDAKVDFIDTMEHQGVRGNFDNSIDAPVLLHEEQQALNVEGFRGCTNGCETFPAGVIDLRADQSCGFVAGLQDIADQMTGRGFAVGTGNTAGFDLATGVTIEGSCHLGQSHTGIGYRDVDIDVLALVAFAEHGHGAISNCLLDVIIAVLLVAFDSDEERAILDEAGIVFDLIDFSFGVAGNDGLVNFCC